MYFPKPLETSKLETNPFRTSRLKFIYFFRTPLIPQVVKEVIAKFIAFCISKNSRALSGPQKPYIVFLRNLSTSVGIHWNNAIGIEYDILL
jgi:hypothetical protein